MVKMTEEVKAALTGVKTYYLATCSKAGVPNVIPMGGLRVLDDETLGLNALYMLKTLENAKENPRVAIAFWGEKGGFQIKGDVTLHTDGPIYKMAEAATKAVAPNLTPKAAIVMKITDVYAVKPGPDAGKKLL